MDHMGVSLEQKMGEELLDIVERISEASLASCIFVYNHHFSDGFCGLVL